MEDTKSTQPVRVADARTTPEAPTFLGSPREKIWGTHVRTGAQVAEALGQGGLAPDAR